MCEERLTNIEGFENEAETEILKRHIVPGAELAINLDGFVFKHIIEIKAVIDGHQIVFFGAKLSPPGYRLRGILWFMELLAKGRLYTVHGEKLI